MNKKIAVVLIIALFVILLVPTFAACTPRENIFKIYNVAEYIGEDVISEFEEYYENITGEKLKVIYDEYDTNETLHFKVAVKKSDYDVIIASDYMIERLIRENLLLPQENLGTDINGNQITDYRKDNVSHFFLSEYNDSYAFDPNNTYSTPFMWGTMGILYAEDSISLDYLEEKGWAALWDQEKKSRISMKKSIRDTYAVGALYAYRNPESPYFNLEISPEDALNETINRMPVQESLIKQKHDTKCTYETDEGKSSIIEGKVDMSLQWSGDALYSMTSLQDELGITRALNYYVPKEGSNIWLDSWAIPKYAQNTKAANLWINFLCTSKIAIENMDYIGYTSCIATEETLKWATGYMDDDDNYIPYTEEDYPAEDLSYFFNGDLSLKAKNVHVHPTQYPSLEIVNRCGVMKDFGENTKYVDEVWTNVLNA